MLHLRKTHPRLLGSVTLGLVVAVVLPLFWYTDVATNVLLAWAIAVGVYLASVWRVMYKATPRTMRELAHQQVLARPSAVLLMTLALVTASVAVVTQLSSAQGLSGVSKAGHLGLSMTVVVLAWLFIHTLFAQFYAHDYYAYEHAAHGPGLDFPQTPEPKYADFLYFAMVIGTSGQTADVSFTNTRMRRLGLVHCVLAYGFNTVILAMTINLAVGIFYFTMTPARYYAGLRPSQIQQVYQ